MSEAWSDTEEQQELAVQEAGSLTDRLFDFIQPLLTPETAWLLVAFALGVLFTFVITEKMKDLDDAWPELFGGPRWEAKIKVWAFVIGTLVTSFLAVKLSKFGWTVSLVVGFLAGGLEPGLYAWLDRRYPKLFGKVKKGIRR